MEDVFEIQDEITAAIVSALKVELLAPHVKRHTEHVEAYHLYLKGRYHWNKRTLTGFRSAIDEFQKAISLDPAYALAYVGIADSYALLGDAGHSAIPPREAFAKARPAVERALEMDDGLAEAHASLGHVRMHEFDWDGARTAFDRAIELDPSYATTFHWYSSYFVAWERHEEAVAAIQRALAVDPVSLAINTDLGVLYYYARRYDDAIAQYRKVLQMEPGFIRAHVTLGSAHALLGRFAEAVASFEKAMELLKDRVRISALGRAYALAGERARALQIIDELLALSKEQYVSPYAIALIYAGLGEVDRGLEWLEKAYDERVGELIFLRVDPYLDNLRADTKFHALLRKVGLGP
jgi:tetratricopeptide (TPR) repeat protein